MSSTIIQLAQHNYAVKFRGYYLQNPHISRQLTCRETWLRDVSLNESAKQTIASPCDLAGTADARNMCSRCGSCVQDAGGSTRNSYDATDPGLSTKPSARAGTRHA